MGWIPNDEALQGTHEGWAAYRAPDGRLSGTSSAAGFHIERSDADDATAKAWQEGRPPTDAETHDFIPWADLVGWQAACECSWTGPIWRRDQTIAGQYGGDDPEDAYLPDGRTVDAAALEAWQAHVAPLETLGRVRAAAGVFVTARRDLDLAVVEARLQDPPASWAAIGRATGMSRQAAHERWSTAQDVDQD